MGLSKRLLLIFGLPLVAVSFLWAYPPTAPQYPTGGAATWGLVTGTLSNQSDLDTALSGKEAADSDIAKINEAEIITGAWTLPYRKYKLWEAAPTGVDLVLGQEYMTDGDPWDPTGHGLTIAHTVQYVDDSPTTWILISDSEGNRYFNKIQAAMNVIADADGIVLTAAQMNSVIFMTGAGEVVIPDALCETAMGYWVTVKASAAHQVEMVCEADEAFILSDGTDCGNGDEADLANAAGAQATFICLNAKEWWVTGEIGTVTDGGAAD